MEIILLWLFLRISSIAVAGIASIIHPMSDLDRLVAIWPPSEPFSLWMKRLLVSPLFHWDARFYASITTYGYNGSNSTTAFYPLYPWTAKLLSFLGLDPQVALVLVSSLAGLAFIYTFERLARIDLSKEQARQAALFVLILPISMVLFIPYTEALFFLLAAWSIYFARKQRWWLASMFAVLSTLAKQSGILLALVLAIELWMSGPFYRQLSLKSLKAWAAVLPIPAAILFWTIIRNHIINPVHFEMAHWQDWFLSLLISPGTGMTATRAQMLWPWQLLTETVRTVIERPETRIHTLITISGYLIMVVLFLVTWRYLRPSYRVYSLIILLSSVFFFLVYYGALPVMSAFRHAYSAFPIFTAVPLLKTSKWQRVLIISICIVLFLLMMLAYSMEAWVA
jgi:hypothetical protein